MKMDFIPTMYGEPLPVKDGRLRPCPFCGGEAVFKYDENVFRETTELPWVSVKCLNCGNGTPQVLAGLNYCATDTAMEYWNKRCSTI